MRPFVASVTAFVLGAGSASADAFTDSIVNDLRGLGYDFIEVKEGPGQVKAEAVAGTQKLEVVYDRATGRILKQERERADTDDIGRFGVRVRQENRDFLDEDERDDDDRDDDRRDDRRDDRDDREDDDDRDDRADNRDDDND